MNWTGEEIASVSLATVSACLKVIFGSVFSGSMAFYIFKMNDRNLGIFAFIGAILNIIGHLTSGMWEFFYVGKTKFI